MQKFFIEKKNPGSSVRAFCINCHAIQRFEGDCPVCQVCGLEPVPFIEKIGWTGPKFKKYIEEEEGNVKIKRYYTQ